MIEHLAAAIIIALALGAALAALDGGDFVGEGGEHDA